MQINLTKEKFYTLSVKTNSCSSLFEVIYLEKFRFRKTFGSHYENLGDQKESGKEMVKGDSTMLTLEVMKQSCPVLAQTGKCQRIYASISSQSLKNMHHGTGIGCPNCIKIHHI